MIPFGTKSVTLSILIDLLTIVHVGRRRWRSHQLTSDLKRCLLFRKCLRWSSLKAVSVPTFVIGGLGAPQRLAIPLVGNNERLNGEMLIPQVGNQQAERRNAYSTSRKSNIKTEPSALDLHSRRKIFLKASRTYHQLSFSWQVEGHQTHELWTLHIDILAGRLTCFVVVPLSCCRILRLPFCSEFQPQTQTLSSLEILSSFQTRT